MSLVLKRFDFNGLELDDIFLLVEYPNVSAVFYSCSDIIWSKDSLDSGHTTVYNLLTLKRSSKNSCRYNVVASVSRFLLETISGPMIKIP